MLLVSKLCNSGEIGFDILTSLEDNVKIRPKPPIGIKISILKLFIHNVHQFVEK